MSQVLIVIPTFNEKENIANLIGAIEKESLSVDILVVDDNSPDGTGKIVDKIIKEKKFVSIIHREKKEGLGRAYIAGFKWGMERGYKKFVSMDADFSHPVSAIPSLVELCDAKSLAIGSRYIKGGKIVGWNSKRFINSWGANLFTRTLLRLRAKDVTSGFKCFPIEFLKSIDLDAIQGSGYAFLVEMSLLAQEGGFKLRETPITFTDRVAGESKISGELKKSVKLVFKLAFGKKSYRQFAKFAVVGASCAVIDWGIFYLIKIILNKYAPDIDLQVARQISKAASFVVSASANYYLNRIWTFKSRDSAVVAQATKFFVVASIGLLFNSAIFYLVTALLGWRDILGLIVATGIVTIWNFFLNKKWTFKVK
jgi:dolichol-phosphate mannosyltransferase